MPIVATALANGNGSSTANASPYTTGSLTPVANQLTLAFVITTVASGGPPPTPTLTRNSLTWTLHSTVTFNNSISQLCRLSVFRIVESSPTAGTASIAVTGSPTGAIWSFIGVAGSDTTGVQGANAIVQAPTGSSDGTTGNAVTPFLTLATFANGGHGALAAFGLGVQQTITPPTGWTELGETLLTNPATTLEVSWINTADTTPDATWGATSRTAGGLALEIRLPAATVLTIGPIPETVGVSDTPLVIGSTLRWDGTINLLNQPHIADTLTLSDPPIVVETVVTGPRTFLTTDQVTLTETLTITGLTLASLLTETVPLTDSPVFRGLTLATSLSDPLTLTDTLVLRGLTPLATVSDQVTVDDTPIVIQPSAGVLFIPAVADVLSVPETLLFVGLPLERLVSDILTLSEAVTLTGLLLTFQTADTLTLSDPPIVQEVTPGIRTFSTSDTIGLVDTPELELFGAISDTLVITEFVQMAVGLHWDGTINLLNQPHVAETLTLLDVPTFAPFTLLPWLVTASDTLTLTDNTTLTGLTVRFSTQETVPLPDTLTLLGLTLPVTTIDAIALTESIALRGLTVSFQTTELVPLPESITLTGLTVIASSLETMPVTDTPSLTGLPQFVVATDTLTLADTPTVIRALEGVWQATQSDTLTLSETVALRGLTLVSSVVETLTTSDVPIVALGAVAPRTFTTADPLTLTDNVLIAGLALPAASSDLLTLTETISVTGLIQRVVATDSITLSDVPNFSQKISQTETVTLTDAALVRGLALKVLAVDSLTLAEPLNVFAGRRASDIIGITESVSAFTIGGIVSQPLLVFAVPARDLTATAIVGLTVFDVPVRNLTVEAIQVPLVYTVEARDFTVEAIVGVTQFVVPARDLSVEVPSAA